MASSLTSIVCFSAAPKTSVSVPVSFCYISVIVYLCKSACFPIPYPESVYASPQSVSFQAILSLCHSPCVYLCLSLCVICHSPCVSLGRVLRVISQFKFLQSLCGLFVVCTPPPSIVISLYSLFIHCLNSRHSTIAPCSR